MTNTTTETTAPKRGRRGRRLAALPLLLTAFGAQLALAPPASALGTWSAGPDLGQVRTQHAATEVAFQNDPATTTDDLRVGKVLVVGGSSAQNFATCCTNTLVAKAQLVAPGVAPEDVGANGTGLRGRSNHTVTYIPPGSTNCGTYCGKVLVIGGFDTDANNSLRTVDVYSPYTNSWSTAPDLPVNYGTGDHTATHIKNSGVVLVVGGMDQNGYPTDKVVALNLSTNTWSTTYSKLPTITPSAPSKPAPAGGRMEHTATLISDTDDKVLVAGGVSGSPTGPAINDVTIFDLSTGQWTTNTNTPELGTRRQGHTATRLDNGKILVAGGFSEPYNVAANITTTAELYDPTANSWSLAGTMITPRLNHTATKLSGGKVLVVGGIADLNLDATQANTHTATSEVYDSGTGTWLLDTASMSVARSHHSATLLNDGKVLVAAGSSSSKGNFVPNLELLTQRSTTEVYTP